MLLPKGKDFRELFDKPPHIVWGVAIAIAILEASVSLYSHLTRGRGRSLQAWAYRASFVWSLVLVCQETYTVDGDLMFSMIPSKKNPY